MSNLEGLMQIGKYTLDDIVTFNLVTYLSYGFLELGAYHNISTTGQMSYDGSFNEARLFPLVAPGVPNYTHYRGMGHNWIWESGITLKTSGIAPLAVSGIVVNTTFVPTGGLYNGTGYTVDYSRGGVIFHHPMPASTVVYCPHAVRTIQVYPEDSDALRRLTIDWWARTQGSGSYDIYERSYLPAIFVGINGYDPSKGREQGSRGKWATARVECTVLAASDFERKQLADCLYMMEFKTFPGFDINLVPMPLNASGGLSTTPYTWAQMSTGYLAGQIHVKSARVQRIKQPLLPVKQSTVFLALEQEVYPI